MDVSVSPRRVLVVEDEVLVRELIVDVLIDDGFEVHAVADARDALSHLSAAWPVDVLFTDLDLPGDIDGERLAVLARKLRPELAVVYASGSRRSVDHEAYSAGLQAGNGARFDRPVNGGSKPLAIVFR